MAQADRPEGQMPEAFVETLEEGPLTGSGLVPGQNPLLVILLRNVAKESC